LILKVNGKEWNVQQKMLTEQKLFPMQDNAIEKSSAIDRQSAIVLCMELGMGLSEKAVNGFSRICTDAQIRESPWKPVAYFSAGATMVADLI
jgi:hypothetical protein